MGSVPMLDIRNIPLYHYPNRFWKRAFDIAIAGIAMIGLSPIMALVALAIKLQDGGPILYTPVRLGVNNKPFKLYKFRSMKVNDNAVNGTQSTVLNDERITRLGKFLRKSNLDELPQLYNVLRNEMSIIGPRPHRVFLNRTLQQKVSSYMVRHSIKPGITGWAQVHGWRGPTESKIQYMGRTLHDLWYIEHWSFAIDFYIIFLTAFGKKTRKNAF
jgi:lipopolysaccharide/colanic/teichoic acid biosynthesis glycosyltransferase